MTYSQIWMVQSCARIISELKTLIKLQNGGNFIIDMLNICTFLFFNVCGEDRHTQKKKQKQKNKTAQQQKTMVIRNVASKKSRAMLYS